jgi:hypothetical protein
MNETRKLPSIKKSVTVGALRCSATALLLHVAGSVGHIEMLTDVDSITPNSISISVNKPAA